jgi:hypothetical protein
MLGAALSFVPRTSKGLLGYMRTFATLAAVAVVATHLLPEALHALGPLSILLFLAGWFAPALAHFIGQRSTSGRPAHAVLEAGYWGLVVHHVADGIGLGTYTRLPASDGSHLDVIVALAAHTVPLIAVVSLAYRTTFGARSALIRSLGLALASVFGIGLSSLVAAQTIESFAPAIAAVAAGLLLHVVTHDLTEDPPTTVLGRTIDLGVAVLGIGVSLLGIDRSSDPATWAFAANLAALANRTSLIILIEILNTVLGLSLRRGRNRSQRGSRVVNSETALLSFFVLGLAAGAVRLALNVSSLFLGSLFTRAPSATEPDTQGNPGYYAYLTKALAHWGPWLTLGFLVSALLGSVPPSGLIVRFAGTAPELALIAAIANLTPVASTAALLIALGLMGLGLSPGAILLFVSLGPLVATLGEARLLTPERRLLVTAACLAAAVLSNRFGLRVAALDAASPGTTSALPMQALALLLLFGVWQRGARLWMSSMVKTPAHEHEHAHDVVSG